MLRRRGGITVVGLAWAGGVKGVSSVAEPYSEA